VRRVAPGEGLPAAEVASDGGHDLPAKDPRTPS
jgi:hypothetical protein